MRAVKKNMADQILTNDKKILHCRVCGAEFSGNKGDYWWMPENTVFNHCGEEMELVEKIVTTVYV